MAAITTIVATGPPIHWSNAVGRAIIAEVLRAPGAIAIGDTQTYVSQYIAEVIAIIGPVTYTVLTSAESGVSIPMTVNSTIGASGFENILIIGYARRVHSSGAA